MIGRGGTFRGSTDIGLGTGSGGTTLERGVLKQHQPKVHCKDIGFIPTEKKSLGRRF